jgi:hypothetical protein
MLYLGGISGRGMLKCDGQEVARAAYEFDGFIRKPVGVTASGDIRLSATALKGVFGRKDIQLLTDDGCLLHLKFSERQLLSASDAAHVDVAGDLPTWPQSWSHSPSSSTKTNSATSMRTSPQGRAMRAWRADLTRWDGQDEAAQPGRHLPGSEAFMLVKDVMSRKVVSVLPRAKAPRIKAARSAIALSAERTLIGDAQYGWPGQF